jgi:hypothetical protein
VLLVVCWSGLFWCLDPNLISIATAGTRANDASTWNSKQTALHDHGCTTKTKSKLWKVRILSLSRV